MKQFFTMLDGIKSRLNSRFQKFRRSRIQRPAIEVFRRLTVMTTALMGLLVFPLRLNRNRRNHRYQQRCTVSSVTSTGTQAHYYSKRGQEQRYYYNVHSNESCDSFKLTFLSSGIFSPSDVQNKSRDLTSDLTPGSSLTSACDTGAILYTISASDPVTVLPLSTPISDCDSVSLRSFSLPTTWESTWESWPSQTPLNDDSVSASFNLQVSLNCMDSTGYDVTQSNEKETSDCYDEDKIREEQCAKDDESVSMSSNLLAFLICGDCAQHPDKVSDCSDTLCKNEECTSSVIDDDGLSASSSLKIASLSSIDIGDDVVDPHKENVNDTSYENDLEEKVYSVEFVASNQSTHGSISSTVAEVDKEVLSHSESTFCANEFGKKHNIDHNGSLPGPSNIKVSHSSVISTCGDVIDVDLGKSDYNSRNEVTEGYGDSSDDEHLFFDKADELHMSSSTSSQILHEVQSLLCTPPLSIDNIFTPHSSRPPCKTLSLEICQDEECPSTLEQDLSSPDLPEAKELWEEYAANRHSSPEYFLFPPFTLEQEEWIVQVDHPFKDYVLQCWQERWHCSMQGWLEDLVD